MIIPPFLKEGDRVGLLSTARQVLDEDMEPAIALLKSWGLQPVVGKSIGAVDHQYAGTDRLRADDLQNMLDDPEIRAIWCAKGGYGTVRIVDDLNFYKFIKNPKWIIGYSDVTVLHSHLHNMGVATLHAPIAKEILTKYQEALHSTPIISLKNTLFGKAVHCHVNSHAMNRTGTAQGPLVGGNLSILYSLCGSKSAIDTAGKVLFLEDLDEYLYHIDRMMLNLKRNGMLDHLEGLIIGGFSDMRDNKVPFGKTAQEIILEAVAEYDYPVCFDFPAGHWEDNRALVLGSTIKLEVSETGVKLNFLEG